MDQYVSSYRPLGFFSRLENLFRLSPIDHFMVKPTVDYEQSLNQVAQQYEWTRAWDSSNTESLTALDLQAEFIHAGLNHKYIYAGTGKRLVTVHFLRFNRNASTEEIREWFQYNGYRPANAKELLFAGLIKLPEDEKKPWKRFSERMFFIVSLMTAEMKDDSVFESGWRSLAIDPSRHMLGEMDQFLDAKSELAKPRLMLKTLSQVGGDMTWDKTHAVFAAVKIGDAPRDVPNSMAVFFRQAKKLGYDK